MQILCEISSGTSNANAKSGVRQEELRSLIDCLRFALPHKVGDAGIQLVEMGL